MKSLAFVVSSVFVLSCASQQKAAPEPQAAPTAQVAPPTTPVAEKIAVHCAADNDCASRQLCVDAQCVDITESLAECKSMRVGFAYDSADISQADRVRVERMARCLKAVNGMNVTIEGNADERGTEEYNLSLGERRAHAVEKQLTYLGVSESQLKTITYGKEKPLCVEHNEACWAKNRRAAMNPVVSSR